MGDSILDWRDHDNLKRAHGAENAYYLKLLSLTGASYDSFKAWYDQWGALLIAVPIPYKITAIASGLAKLNFGLFIGVSVLVRGLRFSLEAVSEGVCRVAWGGPCALTAASP